MLLFNRFEAFFISLQEKVYIHYLWISIITLVDYILKLQILIDFTYTGCYSVAIEKTKTY